MTKAGKGGLKDTPLDGLVFKILEQVVRKSRLDPQMVEDICLGNVREELPYHHQDTLTNQPQPGLRLQGCILRSRCLPRRWLPYHHRC